MIRYRPPAPRSSPYITSAGYRRLGEELESLWERRREVVTHLSAAAREGDRSENAEYIYRKKQLAEMDRRIRYLEKRLPGLEIVDARPSDAERVFFGAWVTLADDNGAGQRHRIVGADETDARRSWISVDSPLSRALLGRGVDDEVHVQTPSGARRYWIVGIEYER